MTMKIDLVYLWVDGSDPEWVQKKNAALIKAGQVSKLAVVANRFENNDELKYSLRSAEQFAPWLNHIYIITDGQRPSWLADNPRVSIVDQSEIVPSEYMPSFNSGAIELFLHKIPGLSEHFLYANDDMFFGAPVTPDFFFDKNGDPIVIEQAGSWKNSVYLRGGDAIDTRLKKDTLFPRMLANALHAAYKISEKKYKLTLSHAIEPIRKSYLADIIESNYDYFMETTATTFRNASNIQRLAFPMINHAKGRTTIVYKPSFLGRRIKYISYLSAILTSFLMWLGVMLGLCRFNLCDPSKGVERAIRKTLKYKPELFCLNYIAPDKRQMAADFMQKMFPNKSGYEK